jgi:hypothetical protein
VAQAVLGKLLHSWCPVSDPAAPSRSGESWNAMWKEIGINVVVESWLIE